jgi:hypothetical protein
MIATLHRPPSHPHAGHTRFAQEVHVPPNHHDKIDTERFVYLTRAHANEGAKAVVMQRPKVVRAACWRRAGTCRWSSAQVFSTSATHSYEVVVNKLLKHMRTSSHAALNAAITGLSSQGRKEDLDGRVDKDAINVFNKILDVVSADARRRHAHWRVQAARPHPSYLLLVGWHPRIRPTGDNYVHVSRGSLGNVGEAFWGYRRAQLLMLPRILECSATKVETVPS